MVGNRGKKIHQTWGPLFSPPLYLQQAWLEHLENGVHGVGDAGLAAVAALVDGVVLGLILRAGDATGISLDCEKNHGTTYMEFEGISWSHLSVCSKDTGVTLGRGRGDCRADAEDNKQDVLVHVQNPRVQKQSSQCDVMFYRVTTINVTRKGRIGRAE